MIIEIGLDKVLEKNGADPDEESTVYDRGSSIKFKINTDTQKLEMNSSNVYDYTPFKLDDLRKTLKIIDYIQGITDE